MVKIFRSLIILCIINIVTLNAEDASSIGSISGSFQMDAQSYSKDSLIGAEDIPQKILSNAYLFLNYRLQGFTANLRYESYNDPILGFDPRLKGSGFAYRSFNYANDFIDVTAGNFYEQFGSGMIFRSYEERQLGFDNAMDGARVKVRPGDGVEVTALVGKMRSFWESSKGIVRGGDLNLSINEMFKELLPSDLNLSLGGSVVSRYQIDNSSFLKLPQNVFAYSTRLNLTGKAFSFSGEYGYKYNDPDASNKNSYNPGSGLYLTASYYPEGLGITINAHRLDNMDFRADRAAKGSNLNINYLPPLSKQQAYRLMSMYPFATQLNGEIGYQAEVTYKIPKSLFNDNYGMDLGFNFSHISSLDSTKIDAYTYDSPFFKFGKRVYYQELNFDVKKKWDKTIQTNFTVMNQSYDRDVMENEGAPKYGKVNATALCLEVYYKFTPSKQLRMEFQTIFTKQDSVLMDGDLKEGDWLFLLAEYSVSPHWFISLMDEYNFKNPNKEYQIHYISGQVSYSIGTTQIALGYGKQRSGLLCVGGVCRPVPASNGFRLNVITSF